MISQLKLLTGRFRLTNEQDVLESIIKAATAKIDDDKSFESEGATYSTFVTYLSNLNKPAGPANKTMTYNVCFTRMRGKWLFESVTINHS